MRKVIGILGGMGPLASIDLQRKIVEETEAKTDQDHLHVITDCNSQIPDRTAAILHGGQDPLAEMIRSAKRLEEAGAELLLIACNTAHYYLEELQRHVGVPFVSMIDPAIEEAIRQGARRVAVLSTIATQATGLYEKSCRENGMEVIGLDEADQELLMNVIYGVKAGNVDAGVNEMKEMILRKQREGADVFFLACSELPVYFQAHQSELRGIFIDPTRTLAKKAIVMAGGLLK